MFLDIFFGLFFDFKVGYFFFYICVVNFLVYYDEIFEVIKRFVFIYVVFYVLGDYGEGVVMGVFVYDIRDYLFWKMYYKDELVWFVFVVLEDEFIIVMLNEFFIDYGVMIVYSGFFKGCFF